MDREVSIEEGMENERMEERVPFRVLLSQLASGSAALVRDEIDLAKQEVREKSQSLRSGVIILAVASVMGLLALMALCSSLIMALSKVMSPVLAALATGVALAIIAGIIGFTGIRLFKKTSLRPEQTLTTLKENKEWLKNIT